MAAEAAAAGGARVLVLDRMPSPARKLLIAGRGGLNLTHSEPLDAVLSRYGAARERLAPFLEAFPPAALVAWAEGLGQATFVGSSGRIFPQAMKASPLLRITPEAPPFLVIHGRGDSLVHVDQARQFVDRLRATSTQPVAYAELPGTQHAFDVFPSVRSAHVVRGVDRFLRYTHDRWLEQQA